MHKTAYEMRISDWSSDGCSSDLHRPRPRSEQGRFFLRHDPEAQAAVGAWNVDAVSQLGSFIAGAALGDDRMAGLAAIKIGRESCRERVCQYVEYLVVVVSSKKINTKD